MPKNPERASRGGDVDGQTRIDVTMGEAVEVASASFDGGYELGGSMEISAPSDRLNKADLVRGYATYGKAIGGGRKG
jgi:hypothetical protein